MYDITSDKKRKKVSDRLIEFGLYRIQYSVFLGSMKKTVFRNLSKTLTGFFPDTEQADDRLLILPITATNLKRITELGTFSAIDWDEIAGNKTTIYIGD